MAERSFGFSPNLVMSPGAEGHFERPMILLRMAWRNLWRYKRRTLITAAGMAMAMGLVLGMSCMQDGMFDVMADVMVRQSLGHAQVVHPDWPARQLLYDTVPDDVVGRVSSLPGVEGARRARL